MYQFERETFFYESTWGGGNYIHFLQLLGQNTILRLFKKIVNSCSVLEIPKTAFFIRHGRDFPDIVFSKHDQGFEPAIQTNNGLHSAKHAASLVVAHDK